MENIKIQILNLLYIFRMFKDKTSQSIINWIYNNNQKVDRIYKDQKNSVVSHIYKLTYNMTPIIDNLYLGNACDASYYYKLKNSNIKSIINVTTEIPNYFKNDFEYFNISINDLNSESFSNEVLNNVLDFIYNKQKTNNNNNNILIHCYMGSSRSATIIVLYLMDKYKYTFEKALEFIKDKRDIVNINTQFIKNLKEFKRNCNKKLLIKNNI
tara:strand:- start:2185 stop:2820 length:636 start_codon:yes stop_codon:yes gene_type:complete